MSKICQLLTIATSSQISMDRTSSGQLPSSLSSHLGDVFQNPFLFSLK